MAELRYLLDTNILSYAIKNPHGLVSQHLRTLAGDEIGTSIIVASELRYGAVLRASAKLTAKVEQLLESLLVLPFDSGADRHYADIRTSLEKSGTPIGQNDLFIAAHARALGLVLVTNNTREFERVPGLVVENWLSPAII
jgi:tRNA(fMet)-specific endonuclease VapC